jgi:MSHA biogenesis protein MshQ
MKQKWHKTISVALALALVMVLVAYALPTPTYADPGPGWHDAKWKYRKKITLTSDTGKIPSTQSYFPVLINLSSDSDLAADAQDDGDDILFTSSDGTTKLDHEIEKFNGGTGALVAWVEVPSLSTGTAIYIYYGNGGASNQQNPTGVWDSHYKGVWHLNETSGTHYDATANSNDGTPNGGVNQNATGKVNGADDFDGSDDAVISPDSASLDITANVTIEAWINSPEFKNQYPGIACKWDWSSTNPQRSYALYLAVYNKPFFMISDNGQYKGELLSGRQLLTNTWYHLTGVSTGSEWILYIDGEFDCNKVIGTTIYSGTGKLSIGASMQDGSVPTDETFKGTIDEVRVSDTARTADWIKTCYQNQNDPSTFYNVGSEENNWESYSDSGHTTVENSFSGATNHVYMRGEGFPAGTIKIGYYDGGDTLRETEAYSDFVGGTLETSECLFTDYGGVAMEGTWHARGSPASR